MIMCCELQNVLQAQVIIRMFVVVTLQERKDSPYLDKLLSLWVFENLRTQNRFPLLGDQFPSQLGGNGTRGEEVGKGPPSPRVPPGTLMANYQTKKMLRRPYRSRTHATWSFVPSSIGLATNIRVTRVRMLS